MKISGNYRTRSLPALALAATLALAAGCSRQQTASMPPARTDQQVTSDIQARIAAESALNGQNIQVTVSNGVATLSGSANDDASRALAGNDAGSVSGVKTVVNNLTVEPPKQAAAPAPQIPAAPPAPSAKEKRREERKEREAKKAMAHTAPPPPPAPAPAPAQTVAAAPAPPPPPPPPPQPVVKTVTVPAGTVIPVRISEDLNSKTAQPNQTFHGTLAADLVADGMVAALRGATVTGRVVDAKDAAHFKGSALLSIELTQLSTHTRQIPIVTNTFSRQGEGRGKNTAIKSGGGAALGAIIGALAGGGKGAAIGAVTGGGAGAGVNAITRGQQVDIAPETLVNFRLQSPITVTTAREAGTVRSFDDNNTSPSPQLERRPQ